MDQEHWYRVVLEYTTDLVTVLTSDGRTLFQSPSIRRVLGYRPSSAATPTVSALDVVHPEDRTRIERALAMLDEHPGAAVTEEFRLRHRDGSYHLFEGVAVSLEQPEWGRIIVVSSRDVTQTRLVEPVTGLPNARLLREEMESLRSAASPGGTSQFSLLLMGVDRFRALSAAVGPVNADRILAEIGRRLSQAVHPPRFIAKLHGDHFAILLRDQVDTSTVLATLARIREMLETPFVFDCGPISLSAGFGIVVAPSAAATPTDVLRSAEFALDTAKRLGPRHHTVFHEHMGRSLVQAFALESALRRAIANREMVVHYQPIVDLQSGRVARVEALVRWRRPDGSLTFPNTFVRVLEEAGLSCEFDLLVLERVCEQLQRWRAGYSPARELLVSVNLSGRTFENEELAQRIERVLERTAVPSHAIEFEVTETALVANTERAADVMQALGRLGIGFGLDDFGTGYSSLSYLHAFPFSSLKIDGSFVSSLGTPEGKPELVRAIVAMAHGLRLKTIAEGVETAEHVAFLREIGCEFGQGYLFAQPLSAAELEGTLTEPLLEPRRPKGVRHDPS